MNHDPLTILRKPGKRIKPGADGVLAARSAGDNGRNFAPAFIVTERGRLCQALCTEHQDKRVYQRRAFKYVDGACQGHASGQRRPELIPPLHAAACAGSHDNGGRFILHGYLSFEGGGNNGLFPLFPCLGWAKIMRPATVCSTRVTVTSTVMPIYCRPPSTTIIVPSSR